MRWVKCVKWLLFKLLSIGISLSLVIGVFLYTLLSGLNDGGAYTQKDYIKYYTLTEPEIRRAPKISMSYYYEYFPGDGYPLSSAITFNDAEDLQPLLKYLSDIGYVMHRRKLSTREVVWESPCTPRQRASIYLVVEFPIRTVRLEKLLCY